MEPETNRLSSGAQIRASFQQKSAGLSLVIIGSAAAYYLARAWPMRPVALAGTPIPAGYGSLVLATLGLIVLAQIVLQIVLVIGSGSAPGPTPAERAAALKGRRNAYGVLTAGVLGVIGLLFVDFPPFCLANLAMISLLAAEMTRLASQLFYGSRAA